MVEERNELEKREEEEDDRTHRILSKAVIVQALYAVSREEVDWNIMLFIDDLSGFGMTVVILPKYVLDKQKLLEFIEEIKKKEV